MAKKGTKKSKEKEIGFKTVKRIKKKPSTHHGDSNTERREHPAPEREYLPVDTKTE